MNKSIYFPLSVFTSVKNLSEHSGNSFSRTVTDLVMKALDGKPESQLDRIEQKIDRFLSGKERVDFKQGPKTTPSNDDFTESDLEAANERLKKKRTEIPGAIKTASEVAPVIRSYSKETQLRKGKKGGAK